MAREKEASGVPLRYAIARPELPEALAERVIELDHDADAERFVLDATRAPHGALRTGAYRLLRGIMSDYDAYGLLGMYPMHLASTAQLGRLLGRDPAQASGALLDVGAGNGSITARLAPLFERVCVTEDSHVMRRALSRRGFAVRGWDLTRTRPTERFEVVSCLNVLDRCARPRSLLGHVREALAEVGTALVSVPLPLSPHVHVGAQTLAPDEPLPPAADTWEAGAAVLASELLEPLGFNVRSLSRAPYLCRGDARRPLYALDAAIFVLEPTANYPGRGSFC